ncbi:MAG: NACHT domain-containing protein, partial [Coleofasciculus sp. S288]|nr:NACHT domain-containing protein [Coleofasciculus sp. S288]
MDIEEALKFADELVFDKTGVRLNKLDKIVLRGTLEGRSYREIQETEAEAKGYEVDYLSRYVAYELRKRLTEALQAEGILKPGEAVRKKNIWEQLEEALKQRSLRDTEGEAQARVLPSQRTDKAEDAPKPPKTSGKPSSDSGTSQEERTSKLINNVGHEGLPSGNGQTTRLVWLRPTPTQPGSQDWGEALEPGVFYGRTEELATLEQWIVNERCQLVTLIGMGGIGKTTLSVKLAKQIQEQFEYIIWRSLHHAPPLEEILTDLLEFLCNEQETKTFATVADGVSRLMEYLRSHRCLVVLDEVETILQPGQPAGYYRDGYQNYGELLKRVGEVSHQSCFVLTSREKPQDIALLQGEALPVRSLQLGGLKTEDAKGILEAKGFSRTEKGLKALIPLYGGNPAALKMVATTIQELFNSNISQFLQQNTLVVGDALSKLLSQQIERLSELEKEIMYWLAIEGKPVDFNELQDSIWFSVPGSEILIALESLLRRSLIEKSTEGREARFTIQPVVMKYVTDQLIEQVCQDLLAIIETQDIEKIIQLRDRALAREQEQDETKEMQFRPILTQVKDRLSKSLRGSQEIGEQLNELLSSLEEG